MHPTGCENGKGTTAVAESMSYAQRIAGQLVAIAVVDFCATDDSVAVLIPNRVTETKQS